MARKGKWGRVYKHGRFFWYDFSWKGRRYVGRGGRDEKEALEMMAKLQGDVIAGRDSEAEEAKNVTFGQVVTWYAKLESTQALKSYARNLTCLIPWTEQLGARPVRDIKPSHLEEFMARRAQTVKRGTVNRELAVVKRAFNLATRDGRIAENPFGNVRLFRVNDERDRVLTPEEHEAVLAACGPKLRPIVELAYLTGMRQGEIRCLQWSRVDFTKGAIRLRGEDTKNGYPREIPMVGRVHDIIAGQPSRMKSPWVFLGTGGTGPQPDQTVRRWWRQACKKAGVEGARFHDLRHTACTNMRRAGVDIVTLGAISGHKSWEMLRRYQTVDDADRREAMRKVERYSAGTTVDQHPREATVVAD